MDSNSATTPIATAVAGLAQAWADAVGCLGGDAQEQVEAMTDAGLLAVNERLAALRRQVDALHVRVAAGIADRSRRELGADSLARKTGHRTPARLIAATTGGHPGDAARLIQVGEATAERATFSGHRAPARHPHVRAGVQAGTISVSAAAAIASVLDRVALRADPGALVEAEKTLAERAAVLSLDELGALLRRAEAYLDPDGLEPATQDRYANRSLRVRERADGMIALDGLFDPETGAPLIAAIDGIVTHALRTSRGHNRPPSGGAGEVAALGGTDDGPGPVAEETRTIPQLQADALAMICRHALGCDRSGSALANTTVIVRIPLDALTAGTGVAEIDGIAQPVDAGAVRRMAADAEIIPCVLGVDSEILDFGTARRAFTRAQRLALEERDGGCAFCGLPGRYAEGHHLWWWSAGGPTDLRNGVLLCTSCHHRVHDDGWEIRIESPPGGDPTGGTVWFLPPATIDPGRAPRVGGRARYDWPRAA